MDYGITNQEGKTSKSEVERIISFSKQNNIHNLDTAPAYGKSEEVLGQTTTNSFFNIYTKTPHLNNDVIRNSDLKYVEEVFYKSLDNLNVDHVEGVFIHNADDLFVDRSNKLYELLSKWKKDGLIKKIGVSIYDETQLIRLLDNFEIDILQIPINIYDQRLIHSNILNKVKEKGIEIHARTIFLQGLLLSNASNLPCKFDSLLPTHRRLETHLLNYGLTRMEGALKFVSQIEQLDYMLVGVNNLDQITEIVQSFNNLTDKYINFGDFQIQDLDLIDPRRW